MYTGVQPCVTHDLWVHSCAPGEKSSISLCLTSSIHGSAARLHRGNVRIKGIKKKKRFMLHTFIIEIGDDKRILFFFFFLCIQSVDVMDLLRLPHWSKASSSYLLMISNLISEWSKWQHSQAAQCNQCNGTELFKSALADWQTWAISLSPRGENGWATRCLHCSCIVPLTDRPSASTCVHHKVAFLSLW